MASKRFVPIVTVLCVLVAIATGCIRPGGLPIVVFVLSTAEGESPLVVTFDASGSHDPDGALIRFDWDFGDGATGTGLSPAHTYVVDEETVFVVRLTITDNDGHQATGTQAVTVQPAPPAPVSARVEFVWPFHYDALGDDAANLNDEYFALQNTGMQEVDLSGWSVENERGVRFQFPNGFRLAVGATVFIHSGAGDDTAAILHWGSIAPIWNDQYDIAVLRDATGLIVDVYAYVSC